MTFTDQSRAKQFFACLVMASIGFAVEAKLVANNIPREYWPAAFLGMLLTTGFAGGGIGALVGRFWIDFWVGFFFPVAAFFALAGWEHLC